MYDTSTKTNGNGHTGQGAASGYGNMFTIGSFRVKPLYAYIGMGVLALVAAFLLVRFMNTSLVMHFGMLAGVLLLIANVRACIGKKQYISPYAQTDTDHKSNAFMNCLIGGALIFAWLSQVLAGLFWLPAVVLVGGAAPLALGHTSFYARYMHIGNQIVTHVRKAIKR